MAAKVLRQVIERAERGPGKLLTGAVLTMSLLTCVQAGTHFHSPERMVVHQVSVDKPVIYHE